MLKKTLTMTCHVYILYFEKLTHQHLPLLINIIKKYGFFDHLFAYVFSRKNLLMKSLIQSKKL